MAAPNFKTDENAIRVPFKTPVEVRVIEEHNARLDRIIAENAKPREAHIVAIHEQNDVLAAHELNIAYLQRVVSDDEDAIEAVKYGVGVQAQKIAKLEQENRELRLSAQNTWRCLRAIAKACRQAGIVIPNPETATRLPS